MGNNEEREWPRRELAEANARNGDRRNASFEDSLLHASSQRLGSIVSELPVNADNELQVRMYLPMTHHRIGGRIAVILNRNNIQLFSSNRFQQSRNHLLEDIFHMQNQHSHWNIQEKKIKKKVTNFFLCTNQKEETRKINDN